MSDSVSHGCSPLPDTSTTRISDSAESTSEPVPPLPQSGAASWMPLGWCEETGAASWSGVEEAGAASKHCVEEAAPLRGILLNLFKKPWSFIEDADASGAAEPTASETADAVACTDDVGDVLAEDLRSLLRIWN